MIPPQMFEPYLRGIDYKYLKVICYPPNVLILEIHYHYNTISYLKWRLNSKVLNDTHDFKYCRDNKKGFYTKHYYGRLYYNGLIHDRYTAIIKLNLSLEKVKIIYNRYYAVQWILVSKHLKIFYKDLVDYIKNIILLF